MGKEFDWHNDGRVVVRPVLAVAAYAETDGIVIRQQRGPDQDREPVIQIPYHALRGFIERLQTLDLGGPYEDASYEDVPDGMVDTTRVAAE